MSASNSFHSSGTSHHGTRPRPRRCCDARTGRASGHGGRVREGRSAGWFDRDGGSRDIVRRYAAACEAQHRAAGDLPGADPEQQHPDERLVGAGGVDHRVARHAHVGEPADHPAAFRRHAVGVPGLDADDAPRQKVRLPLRLGDGHGRRRPRRHRARHGQLRGDVRGRSGAGLRHRQHAALPLCRRRAGARPLPRPGDLLRDRGRRAGGHPRPRPGALHARSLAAGLPGDPLRHYWRPCGRLRGPGLHRVSGGEGRGFRPARNGHCSRSSPSRPTWLPVPAPSLPSA